MDALQPLRDWLNNNGNYMHGVYLYRQYGGDESIAAVFAKGATDYTRDRLFVLLKQMYEARKNTAAAPAPPVASEETELPAEEKVVKNEQLITACDEDAKKIWKQMMAKRSELFALVRNVPGHEDVNTPDRIKLRGELCFEVRGLARKADEAYDVLAFVKEHGHMPNQEKESAEEYTHIADHEIKNTIDNIRKNLSKLRKREQTPGRIALIQQHEKNLEKLLVKWHSLKQKI